MSAGAHVALFLITVIVMEGVAWAMHKYVMHGPLWFIHRSHHEPHDGWWERNDAFGLFFSTLSMVLIYYGLRDYPALLGPGLGLVGYGFIYFMLHDVLVHRRLRLPFVPKGGYLRRIYQAHHLHHATRERQGAAFFGFALAPSVAAISARKAQR
ncbi:MAG: beta-carotene hydroxylase [Chromatiales bacterium]|jgi:beta-carotene 3-hydroxylase|nr:beta-carotene hydroxylase [Chromatiales bacterium]